MQSIENSRANQYRDRIVMITLYTLWQDTQTRLWHPVGLLRRVNDRYMFVYTKGAELAAFIPFKECRTSIVNTSPQHFSHYLPIEYYQKHGQNLNTWHVGLGLM